MRGSRKCDLTSEELVIHAVTHAAVHSLCSCACHMRNMISQHLLLPLEIPFFPRSTLGFFSAALTERQVQELVSERQLRCGVRQLRGLGQKVLSETCVCYKWARKKPEEFLELQ